MNHIEHTIYYECVYPKFFWNKKRELSSPEFTVDLKKNRIYSGSQSESDISDISGLSIPEENSMATQMESTDAAGEVAGSESALLTLQETHLKQLASLMEKSFQPQISQIIKDSFQTQISELVTSIVSGVLEGLTNKLSFLESENKKLLSENSELRVKVLKLEDAVDTAEQYQNQNQNQNCLLVIRPRTIIHQDLCLGKLVPSPHKRSKLSN